MTENNKYNVEDFWPGAEELLDQHFQKKGAWFRNRRLILLGLVVAAIGGFTALWLNVSSSGNSETLKNNQTNVASNEITNSTKKYDVSIAETNKNSNEDKTALNTVPESNIAKDIAGNETYEKFSNQNFETQGSQKSEGNHNINTQNDINSLKSSSKKAFLSNNSKEDNNFKNSASRDVDVINQNILLENIDNIENTTSFKTKESILRNSLKTEKIALTSLNTMPAMVQPQVLILADLNNYTTDDLYKLSSIVNPEKNKKQSNHFFFTLGAGINYIDKNITSNSYPDYVLRRNNEENAAFYSSFNVHFGLNKNRFSISTGIELNQYGENVKYDNWLIGDIETINSNILYITDSISNTVNYYFQGNEFNQTSYSYETDSLLVNDTTLVKGQVSKELSGFSSRTMFSYVELPVILEYSVYSNRSFAISLNSGLSIGFLRATRGFYLNPELNEVMDISNNNTIRKAMLNGRIGTSFNWKIGDKSSVFVNPEYRFNLQSVFNKKSGLDQRYQTIGLQFGIMKRF
jgi:hypothetical protein